MDIFKLVIFSPSCIVCHDASHVVMKKIFGKGLCNHVKQIIILRGGIKDKQIINREYDNVKHNALNKEK